MADSQKKTNQSETQQHKTQHLQDLEKKVRELYDPSHRQPSFNMIHLTLIIGFLMTCGIVVLLKTSRSGSSQPPEALDVTPSPAPVIGVGAVVPKGCREVTNATIPDPTVLAEGSRAAIAAQQTVFRENKYPIEIENSIGMRFRLIPGPGIFRMGSPPNEAGRGPDEADHVVKIPSSFYMSKYEVTQKQFRTVMGFNPSSGKLMRGDHFPVQEVSWYDAKRFCRKLAELEGLPRGIYRLPSEREWEYACRAGTQTPFYFGYYSFKKSRFFMVVKAPMAEPVGQRYPNAWGLYNMHGNVMEWCLNNFYDYTSKKITPEKRAIRGGSWYTDWQRARSAKRHALTGTSHGNILGFRIIRLITPGTVQIVSDSEKK